MQEVTVSKAEADEARAAAEAATPRMQATSRFGVCCLPPLFAGQLVFDRLASVPEMLPVLAKHKCIWTRWLRTRL